MNADELLGKLRTDPAFATKYGSLKTIDQLQAQLKLDGYNLSTDEIKAGLTQIKAKAGELSDADLADVTGGADDGQKVGFYKKTCPNCGSPTKLPAEAIGLGWECPKCGAVGGTIWPDDYDK